MNTSTAILCRPILSSNPRSRPPPQPVYRRSPSRPARASSCISSRAARMPAIFSKSVPSAHTAPSGWPAHSRGWPPRHARSQPEARQNCPNQHRPRRNLRPSRTARGTRARNAAQLAAEVSPSLRFHLHRRRQGEQRRLLCLGAQARPSGHPDPHRQRHPRRRRRRREQQGLDGAGSARVSTTSSQKKPA